MQQGPQATGHLFLQHSIFGITYFRTIFFFVVTYTYPTSTYPRTGAAVEWPDLLLTTHTDLLWGGYGH